MPKRHFKKLQESKGGLVSFNNFLSTSKDRNISLRFTDRAATNPDMVGVLFVMTINPAGSTTPFASTKNVGYSEDKEDEVLFSMHTVFRINDITSTPGNDRLFEVQLTLISDSNHNLRELTEYIRAETYPDETGWYRLGLVLLKIGHFKKAQQIYEALLQETTDEPTKGRIYNQLGVVKHNQEQFEEAIEFHKKALEIYEKTLSPADLNIASCYNDLGMVYSKMGDDSNALSCHKKALEIRQPSLPSNHFDLGLSHNNLGLVYYNMSEYSTALSHYEKALEILQLSLPSNHLKLGVIHNKIGLVYFKMADYSKALSHYEKSTSNSSTITSAKTS